MSRLRLLPLLLLLVAPRAWAAIAFDSTAGNSKAGTSASGASFVITITIVAGETAIATLFPNSGTISSISGGGTWAKQVVVTGDGDLELWSNGAGGGTAASSITVNLSTTTTAYYAVAQYTGVGAIGGTATNYSASASTGVIQDNCLGNLCWVAGGFYSSNGLGPTLIGNSRVSSEIDVADNTNGGGTALVEIQNNLSGGTNDFEAVAIGMAPSPSNVLFDTVAADIGSATGTTSPISVTISMIAGETGICAIGFDGTVSGDSVTSITGGGTWKLVKGENASALARAELWTNGAGGGATASSISVAFTGTVTEVTVACGQYLNVGLVLSANATVANGTTGFELGPVSLTTVHASSIIAAALAGTFTSAPTLSALTGALRVTKNSSTVASVALNDNSAVSGSVSNGAETSGTLADWAAVAVELAFSSGTPGWMSWGFGQ